MTTGMKIFFLLLHHVNSIFAAKNNIGVVIALWAPIILVSMVMLSMCPRLLLLSAVANFDIGSIPVGLLYG